MEAILHRYPALRHPRFIALGASVVIGLIMFLAVFLVGRELLNNQPTGWTAQAAVVIFPNDKLDTDLAATYYSTLTEGQIPNTLAEYFRLPEIRQSAVDQVGASGGGVSVEVVEGTSMITITADASTPVLAERLADVVLEKAESRIEKLPVRRGYELDVASRAEGTAKRTGIDTTTFLGALVLVAVVAAIAIQQVALHLASAMLLQRMPNDLSVPPGERAAYAPEHRDGEDRLTKKRGDRDTEPPDVAAFLELWGSRSKSETSSRSRETHD